MCAWSERLPTSTTSYETKALTNAFRAVGIFSTRRPNTTRARDGQLSMTSSIRKGSNLPKTPLTVCVCVLSSSIVFFFLLTWCVTHLHLSLVLGETLLRIHTRMNIFMGLSWLKALVSHRGPSLQLQKRFLRISQGLFYFPFLNFGSCSWKLCTVSSFAT